MDRSMPRSVFVKEAAALLGVSRRTVYCRIKDGRLQTVRTACGSQRVLVDSIATLLREEWSLRLRDRGAGASDTGLCGKCPAPCRRFDRPWLSRRATLIISHSMRARVGMQLVVERHGDLAAVRGRGRKDGSAARMSSEMAARQERGVRLGERHHPPHFVLQLADVAGPAIQEQPLHGFFGDADVAFLEFLGGARRRIG